MMPHPDSFWALMRAGIAVGRKAWKPVNVCVYRSATVKLGKVRYKLIQEIGLLHNLARPASFRMTFRLKKTKAGDHASKVLLGAVKAVFSGSPTIGHYEGAAYIHLPLRSIRILDASWRELVAAVAGKGDPRKRWAPSAAKGSLQRADRFIRRIMQEGPAVWTPDYACFRTARRQFINGHRYLVWREGLWNEWDNEMSLYIEGESRVAKGDSEEIVESGLIETLGADFARRGYETRTPGGPAEDVPLVQFVIRVDRKTTRREAHRLLKWQVPGKLPTK